MHSSMGPKDLSPRVTMRTPRCRTLPWYRRLPCLSCLKPSPHTFPASQTTPQSTARNAENAFFSCIGLGQCGVVLIREPP